MVPFAAVAAGSDDGGGNHAIPFMRMGAGARALGMGGAYVAAGDDAAGAYWNPAQLAWACGTQVSATYALGMVEDRGMSFVNLSHRFRTWGLGASLLTAGMKDLMGTDRAGNETGLFDYSDLGLMVHAAYAGDFVAGGVTLKYIHEGVNEKTQLKDGASGYGFDLGVALQPAEWMRVGLALKDLVTEVGSYELANDVPWDLRLGAALTPLAGFTFAMDVNKVEDVDHLIFRGGAEYAFPLSEDFGGALRLGLNDTKLAAGLGVRVRFLQFDYAFVQEPQDFMDESHRIGVTMRFGCEEPAPCADMRGKDSDLDGIYDNVDRCPNAAEDMDGFEDADGCPDVDNDGDGVPDVDDDCPNMAEDLDGFNDMDGCPDVDNDGDGIRDADDRCPNAAENFNRVEDTDGCPDAARMELPLAYINFKYNSAEISGADPIPVLEEVAKIMKQNPEMQIRIVGHTDNRGTDAYNQNLSLRRAEAIRDYLTKRGVEAGRMQVDGKGEAEPIDSNDTELGMARNRRIEFKVMQP
jgi:outer membrane protein OmpA-like peptidoglycan-associated protein